MTQYERRDSGLVVPHKPEPPKPPEPEPDGIELQRGSDEWKRAYGHLSKLHRMFQRGGSVTLFREDAARKRAVEYLASQLLGPHTEFEELC